MGYLYNKDLVLINNKNNINNYKGDKKWYVYKHVRVDNKEAFYIGIGCVDNLKRAYDKNNRNKTWKEIVSNTSYDVEILHDKLNYYEAELFEIKYISFYGRIDKNNGSLCNKTDGGGGYRGERKNFHTEETKEILRLKAKIRNSDVDYIENLKNKGKKRWESISKRQKINNIMKQPNRKSIEQYSIDGVYIKRFKSLREIERELGFFRANISPCLKGIFKQAYGFKWRYS